MNINTLNLEKGLQFVDKIEDLSAMPNIALDIMALLNDPGSSLRDVTSKVQLDQAMISYILKHCNSPLYGIRNEVTSISMAINLLGYSNLKSILMAYFMRNLYQLSGKNDIKNDLWKHSIGVAVFSKILAPRFKQNPDEAYLGGLLHDMGKMILYLHNPEDYEKVMKDVTGKQMEFSSSEQQYYPYDHTQVGYFLMEKWKFSVQLKEITLKHHDIDTFAESGNKLLSVVAFANEITHVRLEERTGDIQRYLALFNMTENTLEAIVGEGLKQIEDYVAILS